MNTRRVLVERFGGGAPCVTARAPGRVNLIGEHTDYNEGFVLPTIIAGYVEVTVRPRPDQTIRMLAVDLDETWTCELGDEPEASWPDWARYLGGLAEELGQERMNSGFDLAVGGTVPRGSGLSSSAALETAAALAFERAFDFQLRPLEMVVLCRDVEHRWAGVNCGIMDQMASRLGRPGRALLIDCRDQSHRNVPLGLGDYVFVVVDSGVRRRLEDSAYNERRAQCEEGVALLRRHDKTIRSLRDVSRALLDTHAGDLSPDVAARCRHVVEENDRVLAAEVALSAGDLPAFGRLMTAAHNSLRDLYDASHLTVDRLVEAALSIPGVFGSRQTGAGWGGCTVTLCEHGAVEQLSHRMEEIFTELDLPGAVLDVGRPEAAGIVESET